MERTIETTHETLSPHYEDVCVKEEFEDSVSNSGAICETLDSKCSIKKETDDLCDLNYGNKDFVENFDGGVGNDMCLKKVKLDIDDLKEGFCYESSCSEDSHDSRHVVKSERKLPSNLFELKNNKESVREQCPNAADEITYLFCDACNFCTKYRGNMLRHIKTKHSAGHNFKLPKRPEKSTRKFCNFCQFSALKKRIISKHIFKVHVFDLPEGDFDEVKSCYICNYESANKMEFLAHFIATHHAVFLEQTRNRPVHTCDHCKYSSNCRDTLRKHIEAVHLKLRRYRCHLCDYRTNYSAGLRIHLLAKHEKIKPFKCALCKYSSSYEKHLRRHVRTQHEMKKKRKPHVRRCHTQKID